MFQGLILSYLVVNSSALDVGRSHARLEGALSQRTPYGWKKGLVSHLEKMCKNNKLQTAQIYSYLIWLYFAHGSREKINEIAKQLQISHTFA